MKVATGEEGSLFTRICHYTTQANMACYLYNTVSTVSAMNNMMKHDVYNMIPSTARHDCRRERDACYDMSPWIDRLYQPPWLAADITTIKYVW